jgi:LPPG:FO 2-phospho-L-lactate transferase
VDAEGPDDITAVVNTGDDVVLHGLAISPDVDTVTYTLAGAIDPRRGWGLRDETWRAMEALARYEPIRPATSSAAPRWFNLGDQDLATHLYRTARLAEGARLTDVTDEVRRAWDVSVRILPMSDDRCSTIVTTVDHGDVAFQDYFVRLHHDVPVTAVRSEGEARATPEVLDTIRAADVVVIAPSNPIVSIGPIRALPDIDALLAERRERVVAVSPIVGGAALKGPADRMLTELGHEASVVGVARMYAPVAAVLVVDPVDRDHAAAIEAAGMRCVVTPSVMSGPQIARDLARVTVDAVVRPET